MTLLPPHTREAHPVACPCCGMNLWINVGEVYESRIHEGAMLKIVGVEPHNAVVKQLGREKVEEPWPMDYEHLMRRYFRV